ncbi:MAG: hypothetical protein E7265_11285 [Lachnospiraceae bacterium]|nr:hypothetical protein [Lachnospiraceae bacterium]
MIAELKVCQDKLGTGFIFGAKIQDINDVEKQFNIVEGKDTGDTWVPWYNMHKVLWGLIDVYRYTDNDTALEVAKNLGNWIYNRVSKWDNETNARILGTEYGGMNDCLYELYSITRDARYLDAAHRFDDPKLFGIIISGKMNTLSGRHANTTIPKFVGALKRYTTLKELGELSTDDEKYLKYAEAFWDLVISKHSFATGGVSVMEHFRDDMALDATRSQTNCESCCVHNLLRLSRELFMVTGKVKYADYYEKALRNAIMGAIDTKNGTFSYFTPMATGYFKFFGEADPADNMYWCCTGTGMENYTKLCDSIYFHNKNDLVVNQYIASILNWKEKGITITQDSDVTAKDTATFTISIADNIPKSFNIFLRIPEWISGNPYVSVNGTSIENINISDEYIMIQNTWQTGDTVTFKYPMSVQAEGLPDNNTVFAFRYGPTLLAAELGTKYMDLTDSSNLTWAGANLSAPYYKVVGSESCTLTIPYGQVVKQVLGSETLQINDTTIESFIANIEDNMIKDDQAVVPTFKLTGTDADDNFENGLNFVPFNTLNDQRYGIYWYFSAQTKEQLDATILSRKDEGRYANSMIDSIQPGYGQYEKDSLHNLTEFNSISATTTSGESTRHALADGYFQYNMITDTTKTNMLLCKYSKEDNGKTMKISIGDTVIATETLDYKGTEEEFDIRYTIPKDVLEKNVRTIQITTDNGEIRNVTIVTVKFESNNTSESARLIGGLYMTVNYNNNSSIKSINPDTGKLSFTNDTYTLTVPKGTPVVKVTVTLEDTFGLLYIDGILVNDGKAQTFTINGNNASHKLVTYAEDHTTKSTYTLNIEQA